MNFQDKVVLITGGSQGIGLEMCKKFSKAGAKVMILDINYEKADKVAQEINDNNGYAKAFKTDVTKMDLVQETINTIVEDYGTPDVLINSAGIASSKKFMETTEADFNLIMDINLRGIFNTCKSVVPIMIEKKQGRIINIASIAGKRGGGIFGTSIYATSKAAVIGLTKALARELGEYGITTNAICPGPINTSMIEDFKGPEREKFIEGIPLRRIGQPEDIANFALFLASSMASYVNGEISDVDGGIMLD